MFTTLQSLAIVLAEQAPKAPSGIFSSFPRVLITVELLVILMAVIVDQTKKRGTM